MIQQFLGFPRRQGRTVTATYQSAATSETDASSYSFTSQAIGTASADRVVVVAVFFNSGSSITCSAVTVGGNSATSIVSAVNAPAASTGAHLWAVNVTSGTTATIDVTLTGTSVRASIIVWTITGTGGSTTAHNTATSTSGDPTSTTVNTLAGGCIIAAAYTANSGTNSATWSGVTENVDAVPGAGTDNCYTGGSTNNTSTASGVSVSVDWASAPTRECLAVASW